MTVIYRKGGGKALRVNCRQNELSRGKPGSTDLWIEKRSTNKITDNRQKQQKKGQTVTCTYHTEKQSC
jgi:hypothetical protein